MHYTRGTDKDGNSMLILKSGANTGLTKGRIGNVLHLNGIDAGAVVGNFPSHPLKYVYLPLKIFGIFFQVYLACLPNYVQSKQCHGCKDYVCNAMLPQSPFLKRNQFLRPENLQLVNLIIECGRFSDLKREPLG